MTSDALPAPTVPDLPIHELLALEAVSRLGSVLAAAEALHVTPSGISHRIASLSRRVGQPLLERRGRGVVLTAGALAYVAEVGPGLQALSDATAVLHAVEHRTVRLATAAAIGAAWLLPQLPDYLSAHAGTHVEIMTMATAAELTPGRWDLMIHYGQAPQRGHLRRPLFRERLQQVCAPSLLPAGRRVLSAQELAMRPILRLAQLDQHPLGAGARASTRGTAMQLVFDDALSMLEAAAAGAGVASTTVTAARPFLDSGRLVPATAETLEGEAYVLDLSEAGRLKPAARQLFDWLAARAADTAVTPRGPAAPARPGAANRRA